MRIGRGSPFPSQLWCFTSQPSFTQKDEDLSSSLLLWPPCRNKWRWHWHRGGFGGGLRLAQWSWDLLTDLRDFFPFFRLSQTTKNGLMWYHGGAPQQLHRLPGHSKVKFLHSHHPARFSYCRLCAGRGIFHALKSESKNFIFMSQG